MSKILTKNITGNKLIADCLVEKQEYQDFKERIIDQILKNITVKGYRKGHAPREKAMQKVNPIELQSTIIQETIEKFFPSIQKDLEEYMKSESRQAISATVSVSPDHTKETDDGFQFRVITNLLPKIDLDTISTIKIELPDGEDIDNRISKKEFFEKEEKNAIAYLNKYTEADIKSKNDLKIILDLTETPPEGSPREQKDLVVYLGRNQFPESFEKNLIGLKKGEEKEFESEINGQTLKYKIIVKSVQKPNFKTLAEVIQNSEDAKNQLKSEEEFRQELERIYDSETTQIHERMQKDLIIKEVLKVVPSFEMEDERIESEINRIYSALEEQSKKSNISLVDLFNSSGLPAAKETKTEEDVKDNIIDYVKKEFSLMNILQAVYFSKLDETEKIKDEEVEAVSREIKKDPRKFQVQESEIADRQRLESVAFDRILRSKAYNWIKSQVKITVKKKKTAKK